MRGQIEDMVRAVTVGRMKSKILKYVYFISVLKI